MPCCAGASRTPCSIQDTGGRRRFNKRRSREKIDLAVASVMAVGRAVGPATGPPKGTSIYDNLPGILFA